MISITSCLCVFIITPALPINASSAIDVSQSPAYDFFGSLGYSQPSAGGSITELDQTNFTINAVSGSTSVDFNQVFKNYGNKEYGWADITGTATTRYPAMTGFVDFGGYRLNQTIAMPYMLRTSTGTSVLRNQNFSFIADNSDYLVISYMSVGDGNNQYNSGINFTVSSSSYDGEIHLARNYGFNNGNVSVWTWAVTTDESVIIPDLTFTASNKPSAICPIYYGRYSSMPDDLKKMAGMYKETFEYQSLDVMENMNSKLSSMDTWLSRINSGINILVLGTERSDAVSDDLVDTSGVADSAISGLESQESDLISDFDSNLVSPDTSFITQLSTTGNWVRTQFDSLVGLNGAFSGVLVTALTIALALVIVGKMRG